MSKFYKCFLNFKHFAFIYLKKNYFKNEYLILYLDYFKNSVKFKSQLEFYMSTRDFFYQNLDIFQNSY